MGNKRDEFSLDGFDMDDDFDLESTGGHTGKSVSKGRKAINDLTGGFFSGLKSGVFSKSTLRATIGTALPDAYTRVFDEADEALTDIKDLYDTTSSETQNLIRDLKKSVKQTLPQVEGILPAKMKDRLKALVDDVDVSDSERPVDTDAAAMAVGMNETFNSVAMAKATGFGGGDPTETTTQLIKDLARNKQAADANKMLLGINRNTARMVSYQDSITNAYQRKMVELNYKQYFVQRKMLDEMQRNNAFMQHGMKTLAHNTSLPDILKTSASELAVQMMKQNFIGKVTGAAGGSFGQRLLNRNKAKIQGFFKEAGGAIPNAMFAIGEMGGALEMGQDFGQSKESTIGDQVGQMVGKWLAPTMGKHAGKFLKKHAGVNMRGDQAQFHLRNAGKYANRMGATQGMSGNGWFDMLSDMLGFGEVYQGKQSRTAMKTQSINELGSPAKWNSQNNRTLNEIIPGLLSKIHAEAVMTRTGKPYDPISFSWRTNRFESSKAKAKMTMDSLHNKDDKAWLGKQIHEHSDKVLGGSGVSAKSTRWYKEQALINKTNPGSLPIMDMLISKDIPKDLKTVLMSRYDITEAEITKASESVANSTALHIAVGNRSKTYQDDDEGADNVHSSRIFNDMKQRILDACSAGELETLIAQKIVKPKIVNSEHTWEIDDKRFADWILGGKQGDGDASKSKFADKPKGGFDAKLAQHLPNAHAAAHATADAALDGIDKRVRGAGRKFSNLFNRNGGTALPPKTPNAPLAPSTRKFGMGATLAGASFLPMGAANASASIHQLANAAGGDHTQMVMLAGAAFLAGTAAYASKHLGRAASAASTQLGTGYTAAKRWGKSATTRVKLATEAAHVDAHVDPHGNLVAPDDTSSPAQASARSARNQSTHALVGGAHVDELKTINGTLLAVLGAIRAIGTMTAHSSGDPNTLRWYEKGILGAVRAGGTAVKTGAGMVGSRLWKGVTSLPTWGIRGIKAAGTALSGAGMIGRGLGHINKGLGKLLPFQGRDIYVNGDNTPRLSAAGIRKGIYIDLNTQKPVRSIKDITGAVVAKADLGNQLITADDFTKGLCVLNPRGGFLGWAIRGSGRLIGQGLTNVFNMPMQALRAAQWAKGKIGGALGKIGSHLAFRSGVYVTGEPNPRMVLSVIRSGGYVCNGKPVQRPKDIAGEVRTVSGEVVLTHADLVKGIVDDTGQPFKSLAGKALSAVGKMLAIPGRMLRAVKDGVMWAGRSIKSGMGKVFTGNWGQLSFGAAHKSVEVLERIHTLLNKRLPGTPDDATSFEKGADGVRVGSAPDQLRKRSLMGRLKDKLTGTKKEKEGGASKQGLMGMLFPKFLRSGFMKLGAAGIVGLLGKHLGESIAGPLGGTVGAVLGAALGLAPISTMKGMWWLAKKPFQAVGAVYDMMSKGKRVAQAARAAGTAARVARLGAAAAGAAEVAGAGAVGGASLLATAGAGLASAGAAILGIIASPVVLTLGAIALLAGGVYLLYKHYTKTVCPILRFRMAQYGFDLDNADKAQKVMEFEAKMIKLTKTAKGQSAVLHGDASCVADVAAFGIDMKDADATQRWGDWFTKRFKPVFISHMTAFMNATGSRDLQNADKVLKPAQLVQYMRDTHYQQSNDSPYDVMVSPFHEHIWVRNTVRYNRSDVNSIYDTQVAIATKLAAAGPKPKGAAGGNTASGVLKAGAIASIPGGGVIVAGANLNKSHVSADTLSRAGKLLAVAAIVSSPMAALVVGAGWAGLKAGKWLAKRLTTRGEKLDRFAEIMRLAATAGDPHPAIFAAQWAIESNWGQNATAANNLFAIAATRGDGYKAASVSVLDDNGGTRQEILREYTSEQAAAIDRVTSMKASTALVTAKYFTVKTPAAAAAAFQTSGFIKDPAYGNKLLEVIKAMGLDITQPSSEWSHQIAVGGTGKGNNSIADKVVGGLTSSWNAVKSAAAGAAQRIKATSALVLKNMITDPAKRVGGWVADTYKGAVDATSRGMEAAANAASSLGDKVGGMMGGTLSLTPKDINDLIKVVSTEAFPGLASPAFEQQTAAVVDTILNRIAANYPKWGHTLQSVVNYKWAFSKVCGPRWAYGSVDRIPDSAINKRIADFVQSYLRKRAAGAQSSIGGNLDYLNPAGSSASSMAGWGNQLIQEAKDAGLVFGSGQFVHYHGTTHDKLRYKPGNFKIVLSGGALPAGKSAFDQSAVGAAITQSKNNAVAAVVVSKDTAVKAGTAVVADAKVVGSRVGAATQAVGNAVAAIPDAVRGLIGKGKVNVVAMVNWLLAHAGAASNGVCATFVRQALEAGGADTRGHPVSAKDYAATLLKNGFQPIAQNSSPVKGDICVFNAHPGHLHGHICVFTGSGWVSDFKQRAMNPYGGRPNVPYTLYRTVGGADAVAAKSGYRHAEATTPAGVQVGAGTKTASAVPVGSTTASAPVSEVAAQPVPMPVATAVIKGPPTPTTAPPTLPMSGAAPIPAVASQPMTMPTAPANNVVAAQASQRKQQQQVAADQHQAIVDTSNHAGTTAQAVTDQLSLSRSMDKSLMTLVELVSKLQKSGVSQATATPVPKTASQLAPPKPKQPTNAPVSLTA